MNLEFGNGILFYYTLVTLHFANLPQYWSIKRRNQQSPVKVFRQEGFIGAPQKYFLYNAYELV